MNQLSNNLFKDMINFLNNHGYIKLNTFLYAKNIKTELVTGSVILINLIEEKTTVLSVKDKFLWFSIEPKMIMTTERFYTYTGLKRIIKNNEKAQLEFLKSYKEWRNKKCQK